MDPSPDPSMSVSLQLLFLAVLILVNAYFASAEMAIVSVNKNRVKILAQEGDKKAKLILDFWRTLTVFYQRSKWLLP